MSSRELDIRNQDPRQALLYDDIFEKKATLSHSREQVSDKFYNFENQRPQGLQLLIKLLKRFQCWIDLPEPWHWQVYMSLVSVTLFFLPAIIIAACYSVIVYTIWSNSSNMIVKPKFNNNWNGAGAGADVDHATKRVSSRGIIPKAKVKTVKMTLVIVFVFIACWSPYMIYNLLQVFGVIQRSQTAIAIATFIQSLAPLNSAVNPIIYWCFSTYLCRDFRSKPQWMDGRTGRGTRVTDSTSMSTSLSSSRIKTFQLQSVTPAQRKLLQRAEAGRLEY